MINVILSGCCGFMGKVLTQLIEESPDLTVVAGVDRSGVQNSTYPVYADISAFSGDAQCIIDFSASAALEPLLAYAVERRIPMVIGTTGYSDEQVNKINEAAKVIPIFKSGNMSLGINVLMELAKRAATVFGTDYDVEIVEKHHHRKLDAPSGTALMIANAAASGLPYEAEIIYDRSQRRQSRDPHEIGISSVRGGTIVGEHEIIFAGSDEVITISHSAASREIFARGAIKAAAFVARKTQPGLFDMFDLLASV